jgi:CDGSH-type Zn-finger protein
LQMTPPQYQGQWRHQHHQNQRKVRNLSCYCAQSVVNPFSTGTHYRNTYGGSTLPQVNNPGTSAIHARNPFGTKVTSSHTLTHMLEWNRTHVWTATPSSVTRGTKHAISSVYSKLGFSNSTLVLSWRVKIIVFCFCINTQKSTHLYKLSWQDSSHLQCPLNNWLAAFPHSLIYTAAWDFNIRSPSPILPTHVRMVKIHSN